MDSDDGGPFSLTQSLAEGAGGGYTGNSTSVANQYHVWAAAATSTSLSNNSSTTTLPTHFSPVSPTGHGLYSDHLTLHPTQSAVDALSMRLSQGDYHPSTTDRLSQGDGYHTNVGADSGSRHPGNQSDYHDHLVTQERHLGLESYHHISASSSSSSATQQQDRLNSSEYHTNQSGERLAQNDYHSAQQSSRLSRNDFHSAQPSDRLGQNDYHAAQQSDRLGQSDYHTGQQSDRLAQSEYHVASQSDRLNQLDYSSGQSERLQGSLTKQDYHTLGSDQLGQHASSYHSGQGGQQASAFHSGQASDRALAAQTDYHSTQVDLDAVSMHTDFDRRHLEVNLLPKDLVDSGQRGSAMDYLTSQSSRDTLAGLHPDIVGLQREMDLSVGQTISLPQRSAPGDLASTSYALDPATLPRDLSPYSPRDLDRAMLSASDVVAGQVADGSGNHASATGVGLHPQDLAGINLTATSRDLVDMTTLARSGTGRDDLGRVRDVIHRSRGNEIQRALELDVLGSLDSSTASVDLTLNGGSSTKSSSRAYPSTSRLTSSTKRQAVVASQAADIRLQNSLSAVSANSNGNAGINFFPMPTSRDPLNIMAMADPSTAGTSSRHSTTDFTRQQPSEMSRLRRELTAPYTDLGVHPSVLATAASLPMPTFKSSVDAVFSAHGDLICNDSLASSRERLYEMMKQQQFCDAVLGTSLHSIKVHKAVLCSASAYLCGVLSQTCMGKSGGRILTVQFKADIPASSLSAFIDYIYQGRIKLVANTVRDLNVMARCLHMELLKKTSEDMLVSMGASNDADVAIPELILLETLVDKLDKECTASFPVPVPSPPSCHVGVATDVTFLPSTLTDQSCQTEETPARDCDCSSGAVDLRSGGSCLQVGGLGSLSLAVSGDVNRVEDSKKTGASAETTHFVSDPVGSSFPMVKPHHKKHLASQASRVKMESVAVSAVPLQSVSSSLASSLSSTEVTSVTSTTTTITTTSTSTTETMQKLSVDSAVQNQNIAAHRSATPNPLPANKLPSKARKKTSMPASTHSPFVPSTFTHAVLPGQTARPVLHSYGTRAATRTPTKNLDVSSGPPVSTGCGSVAETQETKDTSSYGSSEAQIQMAKHRGRTKKGRIAAALSEALKYSSQAGEPANVSDQKPRNAGEDTKNASSNTKMSSDPVQVPSSSASDISPTLTVTQATTLATTTTALTEAKRSAPRAYRKRLIESVVSDLLLMAKAGIVDQDTGIKYAEGSAGDSEETKLQQLSEAGAPECKGEEKEGAIDTEQLREMLSSPLPAKRKKKGKTRRMLLSSPSSSGGVRVRAPPKKRAKMELELEQLMREEMEEEEEEEEMAAAAMAAMKMEPRDANSNPQTWSQQPASTSVVRIKMPSTKPGKKPRWIKKDQMAHLLIELNQKASSVTEGDCVFVCLLCSNRFLLPKRCLSHIMVTHKVPEAEVLDQIEVRRQEEGEKCADDGGSISDDLVCDICGYRSRENTTYYLHYHKYFKHGVPLPKGWSVYTCDLCGKELFTKFQLKDHKRTHLEKTPFVCEICGAGFQSRSNLHSHVFHRHREEKKHSCDKCDRTFKTRTQLSVHGRTHTGVRPFSCPLCPYRSTTRGNMRLHLINRHKLSSTEASDIMRDMKPDFDVSLRSVSLQASSDSGGEKKSPAKKKPNSSSSSSSTTKTKPKKKEAKEMQQSSAPKPAQGSQSGLTVSTTLELLLKNSMGDSSSSSSSLDKDSLVAGKEAAVEQQDLSVLGSSVVLAGEGEGNVVTLQAADPFPATGGVGMCGEAGTVFLPPGLETMFQQPGSGDLSMTTAVSSNGATTTILVPENFLLQHHQPQALQPQHKQLYPQPQPHFTSFVVNTGPTLQTLTSNDLIVSATTLNPEGLKSEEVVDLGDMSMGAMEVDSTLRQSGLNPADLNLQPHGHPSTQQAVSSSVATSQESSVQLYMQHSPISPAPPISPTTPVYVAVTPTPHPLAIVKQEGQEGAPAATVAVSAAAGGGVFVDQLQQGQVMPQYDPNLSLQAYYTGPLYSHNC